MFSSLVILPKERAGTWPRTKEIAKNLPLLAKKSLIRNG